MALLVAAGFMLFSSDATGLAFHGAFILDEFARLMKLLVLVGSVLALAMSINFMKREQIDKFEFPVLVVLATLGMMLMSRQTI